MLLPWQHSWLQSLSVKNQTSPFATFKSRPEGLAQNTHGSHTVLTLPIRLVLIFLELCSIECFAALVEPPMTSSLFSFA